MAKNSKKDTLIEKHFDLMMEIAGHTRNIRYSENEIKSLQEQLDSLENEIESLETSTKSPKKPKSSNNLN